MDSLFTGLDPRPNESGSSTQKPRRITKAGNAYLRDALYYPALVGSNKDPHMKAFYEKLLAQGKKPMQARGYHAKAAAGDLGNVQEP